MNVPSSSPPPQPAPLNVDAANAIEPLIRKVSRNLLWFLFILFFFSFIDRINIGFAGLTMLKDLGLTSAQFGFATTLFYLAYISCGIPSNLVLSRIGAKRWIGTIMIAWGLASSATLFAAGAHSLWGLRMLVGITEAGFLPGLLLYLSGWFPSVYRARATALFMIAQPVTAAVASALSGYILQLDGTWGLRGWQWLFLIEGLPATVLGIIVFFKLHDSPLHAKWLTPDESRRLTDTLTAEHQSADENAEHSSLWHELCSPVIIRFALTYFFLVNTLALVAVWAPLIIKNISPGSSNRTVGLLTTLPQIAAIVMMVTWGHHSDRRQERKYHLITAMLVSIAGLLLIVDVANPGVKILGVCLAAAGSYTAMSMFWTTPDHVLSLRARAIGIAIINAFGNISSALNPFVVGRLRDITHGFSASIVYSAVLLGISVLFALTLPIIRHAHTAPAPASCS